MTDIPADLTERFDIDSPIGEGGTGRLFRAVEKTSGRKGVLKLVSTDLTSSSSDRQRLKRELVKQATLSHPHLALPSVTGESGKHVWLFRAWVEGQTLRERLDQSGPVSASEAVAIVAQLASALDELHRAGLLFRDLRPDHVVLQADGSVVAFDAGLAAPIEHEGVFELHGTPAYVSPEQAKGKLVSFRSDLYALGVLFQEIASGEAPFGGSDAEVLKAHVEDEPPAAPDGLPDEARELLAKLLEKDPRQRPFSAQQVRRALDPVLPEDLKSGEQALPGRKATLLGMPAASGPPQPPSMAPPRPPSMNPMPAKKPEPEPEPAPAEAEARKPGTSPAESRANPNATQQVALADIIDEQPAKTSAPPPPPSAKSSAPPPPPGASASAPPAEPPADAPAAKKSADATQQLDAVDILDEQPAATAAATKSSAPPPPPGAQPPKAPPPGAPVAESPRASAPEVTAGADAAVAAGAEAAVAAGAEPDAEEPALVAESAAAAGPGAVAPVAAAAAAPELDDLDYDDMAETIARDAPSSLAPMNPEVDAATTPGAQAAPEPQPAPQPQARPDAQPERPTADTVAPAQPVPESRNGVYFLAGGALVFLSACLVVGYLILSKSDEPAPVAAATPTPSAVAAPAPAPVEEAPTVSAAAEEEAAAEEAAAEEALAEDEAEAEEMLAEDEAEATEEEAASEEEAAAEEEEEAEEVAEADSSDRRRARRRSRSTMRSAMRSGSPFAQAREAAREAFQRRDFRAAEQAYQRATSINPNHAGSWAGLGAARMQLRNFNGAAQAYARAVRANPRSSGFFTSLGHAYRMAGNRNGARQAYQRALAIDPSNRSAQTSLQRL
ncbi:MAG TPA: protein kinase [Polyangiaceae bacterium LLY-WYZ-15_(1-7)]|nr:protein kinase [Polyangiaceae bacterium LLY-WYZ-15_(1-7)]HJL12412.1 protein kinase [Polyangiaceae bacterium LLY-WYZ-15_(1-7)]